METKKQFDPVEEVGKGIADGVRVLAPLFSALYPQETVNAVKEQLKRAAIQKSVTVYRRLRFK